VVIEDGAPLVLLSHEEGVSTVTLNRPGILNAIGAEMTVELVEALRIADAEPTTGCIVLTGAGRAFCSGGDVGNMGEGPAIERVVHRDWHLIHALLQTEKPIIAMVHGAAVGLGATLALSCDLTYIAEDARIGDTHVTLGVLAGDGAIVPLVLNAGPVRTKEFVLLGKLISGAEASARNLVTRAHAAGDLVANTYAIAREIAAQPAFAVRATKAVLNRQVGWATHEILETSLALELHSMEIPEYSEAMRKFRERQSAQRSAQ
jgi:enoyl-CoA hydratase